MFPEVSISEHPTLKQEFSKTPHTTLQLYRAENTPKLEIDTSEIKLKFKHLLTKVTNSVKDIPPRKLVTLLSCYDDHYCTLTKECKDTSDVITALIENISFIDYGLLYFIVEELRYFALLMDIMQYKTDLEDYILNRLYSKHCRNSDDYVYSAIFALDTEMCILPRQIGQLKILAQRVLSKRRPFHPNAAIITASSQLSVSPEIYNGFSLYEFNPNTCRLVKTQNPEV